jgi:hypothetical protein
MATYNEKRKYGVIPEPQIGKYPVREGGGIFAMRATVHHCSPLINPASRSYSSSRTRTCI